MATCQEVDAEFYQKGDTRYLCMRFEKNTTFRTDYPTAFGVLVLDIVTEDIMLEGENTGELTGWPKMTVCYQLENEGETLSRFELQMLAKH